MKIRIAWSTIKRNLLIVLLRRQQHRKRSPDPLGATSNIARGSRERDMSRPMSLRLQSRGNVIEICCLAWQKVTDIFNSWGSPFWIPTLGSTSMYGRQSHAISSFHILAVSLAAPQTRWDSRAERKLDRMDKADATKAPEILKSRELDNKNVGKRLELLSAIETKFNEYGTSHTPSKDFRVDWAKQPSLLMLATSQISIIRGMKTTRACELTSTKELRWERWRVTSTTMKTFCL